MPREGKEGQIQSPRAYSNFYRSSTERFDGLDTQGRDPEKGDAPLTIVACLIELNETLDETS
jgi:hypothetical protein